ncbi:hypothetical protein [Georgenia sp. AZ-5]|uniref:hypothetical protein n=1 Tax=Georgenia sp. AZ-5 TaxID=3367526 RepID=UPI00375448D6
MGEGTQEVTTEPEEEPTEPEAPPAPSEGSRENPYPAGATVAIADYTVTLGPTDLDATPEIREYELERYGGMPELTTPPEPGHVYVMVPVTATYGGEASGTAYYDLSFAYVGNQGNVFAEPVYNAPDNFMETGELYKGATASGNLVHMVPADQVEGGVWRVTDWTGTEAFFATS